MKTIFTNFKFIAVTICLLLTGILVNAADRYAAASGDWTAAIWSATLGGLPGTASVPVPGDNVFINATRTVSLTTSPTCANLTVNGILNVTGGSLTIGNGGTVTVNSGGSVVFSAANTINGGGPGSNGIAVTINSGASLTTANIAGFVTGNGNSVIGGSFAVTVGNNAGPNYSTTANYTFNATSAQVTGSGITGANNLIITGASTKTLSAATTITNDVSIGSGATLIAGNFIHLVGGNWTNSGTFTRGTSTITFNSSAAGKTIAGNLTGTSAFNNLTFNGSGDWSLSNAAEVNGTLTLTNGILTTSTTNLLTLIAGASASFAPGSITSFINGPMAKIGNTAFTFPVGKSGAGMRRIAIGIPSTSSTFTAEFNRAAGTGSGIQGGQPANPLKQVSICEHWTLGRVGTGDATVTLSWNSNSVCNSTLYVTDLATLRVARHDGSSWVNEGGTGSGTVLSGTITSGTVSSFSPFALASSSAATNPLPVKFSDVKAYSKQNGVQIEWTNLTESDLVNYIVERSVNGIDFTTINQLAPRSNMSNKEMYNSFDASPVSGANFYRIKAIELDGKMIYSQLLKVMIGEKLSVIKLFPNPVSGNQITLGFTAESGQYRMQVINGIGQQILTQTINHQGGTLSQSITLPETVKAGTYKLVIQGNNYKESKTFIVQ